MPRVHGQANGHGIHYKQRKLLIVSCDRCPLPRGHLPRLASFFLWCISFPIQLALWICQVWDQPIPRWSLRPAVKQNCASWDFWFLFGVLCWDGDASVFCVFLFVLHKTRDQHSALPSVTGWPCPFAAEFCLGPPCALSHPCHSLVGFLQAQRCLSYPNISRDIFTTIVWQKNYVGMVLV